MKITIPYPPSANNYWRAVNGRILVTQDARVYKQRVGWLVKGMGVTLLEGSLKVIMDVYRPRKIGDLDNTLKVTLDSLRGICFTDDKQIIEITARRFDDKEDPRIELDIQEIS